MTLTLRQASPDDGPAVYDMLQTLDANTNGFTNPVNGMRYDDFRAWLPAVCARARQTGLDDAGEVPEITYWLYEGSQPVGYGKIRTMMTDKYRAIGGNVGYALAPAARGRGLGKAFLGLLLGERRRLGIAEVLLTIRQTNAPSLAVALANGGRIEKEGLGRYYVRIRP